MKKKSPPPRHALKMYWAFHRHLELDLIDLNRKKSADSFEKIKEDLMREKVQSDVMFLLDHIKELQRYLTYPI